MKAKYQSLVIERIYASLNNLQKIDKNDMIMGKGLFNRRCHVNAVQYALEHEHCEVYMCISASNDDTPYIHFINKINNKFIDNTLGWEYKYTDYYIIDKIDEEDWPDIVDIFSVCKNKIIELHANKFLIKLFDITNLL